jgi:pyruvate/2-oxoglutarate dehydrogenase complex dihydrolipoamide dehydrogenase (E3) component
MMEKYDVIVIGGSASGIATAVTGKNAYPTKTFLMIRKEKQAIVPCGIPYIFGSLHDTEKDTISDGMFEKNNIDLKIDEVTDIDTENKTCTTKDGSTIRYEKLVIATGSKAHVPGWLEGADKGNVFTIPKDKNYLDQAMKKLSSAKKIVTIGGGFIGVETSDELKKEGKEVIIVEKLPHILGTAFDDEICEAVEEKLKERNVEFITNMGVSKITGDDNATGVELENGETISADAVLLTVGYHPNTKLANDAGLSLNERGFIKVDEYMHTDNHDIMAVGDCAEKRDFVTRKISTTMLASTACAEARIAGMNLFKLSAMKTFSGTIAIFSTALGDTGYGVAGVTEKTATQEQFDVVTGSFTGVDKHPGTMPGVHKQTVKLIAAREGGLVLGGEVIGGTSTGELTNLIGFIIQNKMTVNNILTAQIGTHPLVTAPPTAYPLIKAAEAVARKL